LAKSLPPANQLKKLEGRDDFPNLVGTVDEAEAFGLVLIEQSHEILVGEKNTVRYSCEGHGRVPQAGKGNRFLHTSEIVAAILVEEEVWCRIFAEYPHGLPCSMLRPAACF